MFSMIRFVTFKKLIVTLIAIICLSSSIPTEELSMNDLQNLCYENYGSWHSFAIDCMLSCADVHNEITKICSDWDGPGLFSPYITEASKAKKLSNLDNRLIKMYKNSPYIYILLRGRDYNGPCSVRQLIVKTDIINNSNRKKRICYGKRESLYESSC